MELKERLLKMQNIIEQFENNLAETKTSPSAPYLSDYLDYRLYLRHFYEFKRHLTRKDLRPYTYAHFSAAADIKSPNYLKMIVDGKRNLSLDMVAKFAKALGLNKEGADELKMLVIYNQAEDPADRNYALKALSEFRVKHKLKAGEIDRKIWDKIPNWVTWMIYAMVDMEGVKWDVASLRHTLRGKASEAEIQAALDVLLQSGELAQDAMSGEIKRARASIENSDEIPVALVRKLQSQLMYLGLESLYQDAPTEREFGTLTMCLTEKEFEEIKFKLRQMRKQLHKDNSIARMNSKGEQIYQLNIQLYPVTTKSKKD